MKNINWKRLALFLGLTLCSFLFFILGVGLGQYAILKLEANLLAKILSLNSNQSAVFFDNLMTGISQLVKFGK